MIPAPCRIALRKRKTSVSLEGVFWDTLAEIAATRSVSINRLITEIDRDRNLMTPDGRSGWEIEFVLAPGPLMGDPVGWPDGDGDGE